MFMILLRWIDHNKKERSVKFSQPFCHARLISVSRDFLLSNVALSRARFHVTETKFEHVADLLEARYQAFGASHQEKICYWKGNWQHYVENS